MRTRTRIKDKMYYLYVHNLTEDARYYDFMSEIIEYVYDLIPIIPNNRSCNVINGLMM